LTAVSNSQLLAGVAQPPASLLTGNYVSPTVFGALTPGMTIAREEIFGLVLSIPAQQSQRIDVRAPRRPSRAWAHSPRWPGALSAKRTGYSTQLLSVCPPRRAGT